MPKVATRKKPAATHAAFTPALTLDTLPAIGAALAGGHYAGLSIADNRPVALVLLPGDVQMNWKDAKAWAEKQGGALPSRIDALVLFQNAKGEFKERAYWTGLPCAGNESYAWCQTFDLGDQLDDLKDYELRARAVRRLPIQ